MSARSVTMATGQALLYDSWQLVTTQLASRYFGASGFGRVWVQYASVLYGSGPTPLGSDSAPGPSVSGRYGYGSVILDSSSERFGSGYKCLGTFWVRVIVFGPERNSSVNTVDLQQGWATVMVVRAAIFPLSLQRATFCHTNVAKIADLQAQNASQRDAF